MALETRSSEILRFGIFEVDLRAGELRKQGKRIKVQEQPFHVLTVLLQRPGEVVTREELRSQNWPPDTFRSGPDTWVTHRTGYMGNTFGPNGFSSGSSSRVSRSKYPRS